jgi:hypothetical protein
MIVCYKDFSVITNLNHQHRLYTGPVLSSSEQKYLHQLSEKDNNISTTK